MPADRPQNQSHARMSEEFDLSVEVIVLLILGIFGLLYGLLLFKIYSGDLPYNVDGTIGLFLVIVSFQMITMGKTPFGDLRRSWALVVIGIGTAILGIVTCFIPGYFTPDYSAGKQRKVCSVGQPHDMVKEIDRYRG